MSEPAPPGKEDLDELLQELRVALPGVQVLLAVLLAVPFNSAFDMLDQQQRLVFLSAVMGAAAATVLLIAPSAHHRFEWPASGMEIERLVRIGTLEARAGMLALAWTITAACYVVVARMFDDGAALVIAAFVGAFALGLWVVLPRVVRRGS